MSENQCTVSSGPAQDGVNNNWLIEYNNQSKMAFVMQAGDVALRDLYKLANVARSVNARQLIEAMDKQLPDIQRVGEIVKETSDARNSLRQLTQSQLTPLSRLLSKILDQNRNWQQIIGKYGDPFNEALSAEARLAIANKIIEKSASSSRLMNGLQIFGKALLVASIAISLWQIGAGIKKIQNGKTGDGVIDVTEGGSGIGLTVGTYAGLKTGLIKVVAGTGTSTFIASVAAAGAVAFAFEEARRSLHGEKTMAVEAREYWAKMAEHGAQTEGFEGYLERAAGISFGSVARLIAAGQGF